MTQIALTGKEISKKLDKKIIKNGGTTITTLPEVKIRMSNEHETMKVSFFAYEAIINYNKDRENEARDQRANRRMRSLKRQQKRISCCSTGNELPVTTILNKEGDLKS